MVDLSQRKFIGYGDNGDIFRGNFAEKKRGVKHFPIKKPPADFVSPTSYNPQFTQTQKEGLHYGVATLAEFTQKVPRNSIKFWALSGLFTKQKVPRI